MGLVKMIKKIIAWWTRIIIKQDQIDEQLKLDIYLLKKQTERIKIEIEKLENKNSGVDYHHIKK